MCGRFSINLLVKDVVQALKVQEILTEFKQNYNVAPTQQIPAVYTSEKKTVLDSLRWGLIPFWAKDAKIGSRMINARSETFEDKPSFKHSFRKRRCLIPASSFFEWKTTKNGKQPFLITLKEAKVFAFAGIWDVWKSPEGMDVKTCSIITCKPNALVKKIHDRMPVILPQDRYVQWLHPSEEEHSLIALLKPFPANQMKSYPVSTIINSPKNNSEQCLLPQEA